MSGEKREKEKSQIIKIMNERSDISTDSTDIKKVMKKNYCAGWIVFPKISCLPEISQCDLSGNSVFTCDQVKVRSY